ncbi:odorant receptor coreceptor-like [Zootermopsis nevadensis]|nr:odorant receptor coreceptor-like [Zootermopsis nevadensis]
MLICHKDLRYVINNVTRNFYVHEKLFKEEIISKIKAGKKVAWWITVPYTSMFILTIGLIAAEQIVAAIKHADRFSAEGNETEVTGVYHRKLPLKIWLPINVKESPSYEIGFMYQVVCFTFEIYSTCIIDTFIVVHVMFASIQYELLGEMIQLSADKVAMLLRVRSESSQQDSEHKAGSLHSEYETETVDKQNTKLSNGEVTYISNKENLMSTPTTDAFRREMNIYLGRCIKHHQSLLKYIVHLNILSSPIQFLQALTSSLLICTLGFTAIVSGSTAILPKVLMYTFDALLQIGLPCWFSTQLRVQGERIAEAAYACEWYNEPASFQKSVGFVIMRAQQPVVLTMGPFGTVSLELFAAVVQSAYSYLALLRNVYAEQ